jgi:hypothetical protein
MLIAIWCLVILVFIACILLYRILVKLEYSNDRIHRIWGVLGNIDGTGTYFLNRSEDDRLGKNNNGVGKKQEKEKNIFKQFEYLDRIEDKLKEIIKNTKKYD